MSRRHTHIHLTQILRNGALAALASTFLAPAALAGGEPKNQWPFTGASPAPSRAVTPVARPSTRVPRGEPKNQSPFTRPVVRPIVRPTIVAQPAVGFSWIDGGLGLVAGLGLAAAGALAFTRKSPTPAH